MTAGQFIEWLKANECDKDTELIVSEGAKYGPLLIFRTEGKNEVILTIGA